MRAHFDLPKNSIRKTPLCCLLGGMFCLLTESLVWAGADHIAARKTSAETMGEIVVSADRDRATVTEGAVTLGGYVQPVTPADRARTSDTAALLAEMPGASLQQNGGVSSLPYLHGLGDDRLRIKVDGMDLISACPNHMNTPLSYIDPSNVRALSAVAGVAPVSSGGDSIGGTIVVNSAPAEFAKSGGVLVMGSAGAYYRSNGNGAGANLSATAANEYFSLRYSGSLAQSDNYHSARDFKAAGLAASDRGWLDGDEVGSTSYKSWNHAAVIGLRKENHVVQLNLGMQQIPYEGFPNQRMDMTDNYSEQVNLAYSGQYSWGVLEARVYNDLTKHEMDFADDKQYYYGSAATILAPGMPMLTEGRNTGLVVKAELQLSERDLLKTGVEGQRYRLDDWWPPSPAVLPAGYTSGGMAPDTFWSINNGKRDRLALFGEWEAQWDPRWLSQLGVRSDTVMMDTGSVQGYNNTPMYNGAPLFPATTFNNRDRQRTDSNFDLTALARYTPESTLAFEFGYARKSRSPNLYERYAWSINTMAMEMINFTGDGNYYVGNLDLQPEVANTFSVSADWHGDNPEQWALKVTPYFTTVRDYIDVRRCPTSVCGERAVIQTNLTASQGFVYLQFVNVEAQLYGVDVSGRYPLAKTAGFGSLTAAGLLNYVRGENRTTGDNLYNIMPLNGKVALSHRLGQMTNTVEGQFVAAKTQVSAVRNEIKTSGYGLMNLRSSYEWQRVRLDVGLENVFDKQYDLPLGGAYVGQGPTMSGGAIPWGVPIPGMGRTFYAAMQITF